MHTEQRVVTNRVFLLGLGELYRAAMKTHERGELLNCARRVATALNAGPADVPVEGYYSEDARLTEYFRLVRALQDINESATTVVGALPEFQRLLEVSSAPLYGPPQRTEKLLPTGQDALSKALLRLFPQWTVDRLTDAAFTAARETDDISLVGLAARLKDPVILAAVRESVVLYAWVPLGLEDDVEPPRPRYIWEVDEDLARHAGRFIETFNSLFRDELPPPVPAQAETYWLAQDDAEIVGRCVRLGYDPKVPTPHYHWAICRDAQRELSVHEFWDPEVWTSERYRLALHRGLAPGRLGRFVFPRSE